MSGARLFLMSTAGAALCLVLAGGPESQAADQPSDCPNDPGEVQSPPVIPPVDPPEDGVYVVTFYSSGCVAR